jgi:hypothetical protein
MALSPARHVLEGTKHQTQAKIDASDVSLLMGSKTRLAVQLRTVLKFKYF